MSLENCLENFQVSSPGPEQPHSSDQAETLDELQSFETGFQAGWDDAMRAQEESNRHVSSALSETISDIALQSSEIQQQLLIRLAEILETAFEKLLPKLAQDALHSNISALLTKEISDGVTREVVITVSPNDLPILKNIMADDLSLPVALTSSTLLSDGQAKLTFQTSEVQIDIDQLNAQVLSAIRGFHEEAAGNSRYAEYA